MKRITTDNVNEMGIVGLAHNCCYIWKDGCARYRDFDMDIDAREIAKKLLKELANQDVDFESDEDFDEWIGSCYGEDGIGTIHGLIAMFYQNIWAMAELRESLKRYEDLEEQGKMLVIPCKVGDTVYEVQKLRKRIQKYVITFINISYRGIGFSWEIKDGEGVYSNVHGFSDSDIGKTVFMTRKEAEAALEKVRGGEK